MKRALSIILSFSFLASTALFAAEPNAPAVKWVHIFIRADVDEVRFENIWVFERQTVGCPWDVTIDLPEGAVLLHFDEPNETELLAGSGTIRKEMAADSLIDSVGFSFALPNQDGLCRTYIAAAYRIESMMVYVSGSATKIESRVLKYNKFMALRSVFSSVYTAGNLAAGTKLEINLSDLPYKDCGLLEIVCVVGLGLVIVIALLTLYRNRKAINPTRLPVS